RTAPAGHHLGGSGRGRAARTGPVAAADQRRRDRIPGAAPGAGRVTLTGGRSGRRAARRVAATVWATGAGPERPADRGRGRLVHGREPRAIWAARSKRQRRHGW